MLFLCGLSVMFRASLWVRLVDWMSRLTDQQLTGLTALSSMVFLPLGLVIVWAHNIWEWSPSLIITFMVMGLWAGEYCAGIFSFYFVRKKAVF